MLFLLQKVRNPSTERIFPKEGRLAATCAATINPCSCQGLEGLHDTRKEKRKSISGTDGLLFYFPDSEKKMRGQTNGRCCEWRTRPRLGPRRRFSRCGVPPSTRATRTFSVVRRHRLHLCQLLLGGNCVPQKHQQQRRHDFCGSRRTHPFQRENTDVKYVTIF